MLLLLHGGCIWPLPVLNQPPRTAAILQDAQLLPRMLLPEAKAGLCKSALKQSCML